MKEREKEDSSKVLQVLFAAENFDMKSCLSISTRVKQNIESRRHWRDDEKFEFTLCFARRYIQTTTKILCQLEKLLSVTPTQWNAKPCGYVIHELLGLTDSRVTLLLCQWEWILDDQVELNVDHAWLTVNTDSSLNFLFADIVNFYVWLSGKKSSMHCRPYPN